MRARAVVIACGLAGCGRLDFALLPAGDAGLSAPSQIPALATTADEDDPEISFDGLELYFSLAVTTNKEDIWVSTRASVADPWPAPVLVPELSSPAIDKAPALSSDALTLWLASSRGASKTQIFVATRASRTAAWSVPALVPELSLAVEVGTPCVLGERLVMRAYVGTTTNDLEHAERAGATWSTPQPIAELNSAGNDSAPYLVDGGDTIYFDSDRPGGRGGSDIYAAHRTGDGTFGTPAVVDELSTAVDESDIAMTASGDIVVFSRDSGDGSNDIWTATR